MLKSVANRNKTAAGLSIRVTKLGRHRAGDERDPTACLVRKALQSSIITAMPSASPKRDSDNRHGTPPVSRRVAAEAAIWVSRLSGQPLDAELVLRCVAWQARSPSHRYACERTRATWDMLGQLPNDGS